MDAFTLVLISEKVLEKSVAQTGTCTVLRDVQRLQDHTLTTSLTKQEHGFVSLRSEDEYRSQNCESALPPLNAGRTHHSLEGTVDAFTSILISEKVPEQKCHTGGLSG